MTPERLRATIVEIEDALLALEGEWGDEDAMPADVLARVTGLERALRRLHERPLGWDGGAS